MIARNDEVLRRHAMKRTALVIPESDDPRFSMSWDIAEPGVVTIKAPADSVFKVEIDGDDPPRSASFTAPLDSPNARIALGGDA